MERISLRLTGSCQIHKTSEEIKKIQPVVKILVFAVQEALVHLGDELLPEQRLLLGGWLLVLLLLRL